jgi:hypothetical protein
MTTSGVTTPAPMEGHGAYNRSSRVQAAGLAPAVSLFERAARAVALAPSPQPIVIADYGSSEGHNSLAPISVAIEVLRGRVGADRAISVVHTDLPGNDFAALFQALADDQDSYMRGDPAVFPSAVGRSFYQQILPANSVTLGWSSWAVQWLSRVPGSIPDQVQVAYSKDPSARAAFTRQAAEDWRAFLDSRGRELAPGGRLVVMTMAFDDTGDFGYRSLVEAVYAALMDLVDEGLVRAEEARRMVIPTVGRSRTDLAAPFAGGKSYAGLALEHLEVFHGEDRIFAEFEANGDAKAFGAAWAAFTRASVFPTLAAGLDGGGDTPRAAEFMDQLEANVAARLAAAPEPTVIPLAQMLIAEDEAAAR